jgi:hypothetical protein
MYTASFFLVAVRDAIPVGEPTRGFSCAYLAFLSWFNPSAMQNGREFAHMRFAYVCLMISGWNNPLFL